jgi:flagellar biosynthetic protein FliO
MGATFLAFGRMLLVLGLIIGLLVVLARFGRKWQASPRFGAKSSARIDVVSRRSLGKNISIAVVQVGRRSFLVGQAAQAITLLAELDADEWSTNTTSSESAVRDKDQLLTPRTVRDIGGETPRAWDAFIDHLREITVRR